jgi:superfamily II DNA or RNA helicase
MLSKRSFDVVKNIEPRAVFGLTATLQLKKKPIRMMAYNLCGPVIFTYPISQGVEEGYLAPGIAVFVEFRNDQTGRSRNYHVEYDSAIAKNAARNNLIEGLARAGVAAGRSVIILVERIKHLKDLSYRFHDLPHNLIWGARPADQRIIDKNEFERSEVKLILATKVLKKGIDIRKVDMIIDGAALGSQNDAVQKFGRGVRTCDGKKGLLYFDIADIGVDRWGKEIRSRFTVSARKRISAFKTQRIPTVRAMSTPALFMNYDKIIRDATAKLETLLVKTEMTA